MKLRTLIYSTALVMTVGAAGCQNSGTKAEVKLTSQIDSVSYSLGVLIAENNKQQLKDAPGIDQLNKQIFLAAYGKTLLGDSVQIKAEKANETLTKFFDKMSKEISNKNLKAGEDFLTANKSKSGVVTLPSGLQYEILTNGTGAKPKADDVVKCHYKGTTIDGEVFDSSIERGEPAVFAVNQVIPGWTEALQLMPIGSKWKLYIPASLAYGEAGAGRTIEPNSALIFEVELLGIEKK